ncbi:MAG: hypothetical protein R3182_14060, partial [Draconibacterium sp.]|nr:hypothetical protein [Draconibacterium sp.]
MLLVISVGATFYLYRSNKNKQGSPFYIVLILFQFLLNAGILIRLYPDLESMYLSQLPHWLFKEGVLVVSLIISIGLTVFFFRKHLLVGDFILKGLVGINGFLFTGTLCFMYVSATVRSSEFSKNSFQKLIDKEVNYFSVDTKTTSENSETITIYPSYSIPHDLEFGGDYISAGDLTGDGIVEIITAKYWVEPTDVNRIKSISVQSLLQDSQSGKRGKVLWKWQSEYPAPPKIVSGRGSSSTVTVFDLQTGEANNKLLFATDGWLYEYTFANNKKILEKKVATGTVNASDCLIIANLDGSGKHHLLLKDAYHTIWAYDQNLNLLWKTKNPGGYLLSHRIAACDLNEDGIDEILAGATILNNKGEVISTLKTESVKLWYGGHIDGIVPIKQNDEWSIGVTYCDGLGFALFDTEGNCKWEVTEEHFEYLVGGYFFDTSELSSDFQLISKVHYDKNNSQVIMNQNGSFLGMLNPSSTLFSADWTGDAY